MTEQPRPVEKRFLEEKTIKADAEKETVEERVRGEIERWFTKKGGYMSSTSLIEIKNTLDSKLKGKTGDAVLEGRMWAGAIKKN